jgi:hypothetical protein
MTDGEMLRALTQAADTLCGISVPVNLTYQVAAPILDALAGVRACAEALRERADPANEERAIREDEI